MSEIKFLLSYTVFIFFFILLVTLGAPTFLSEEARSKIEAMTVPKERPSWVEIPIIGPIYGFFRGIWDGLYTLYILLTFSSTIKWLTLLIVTPFLVTMFYVILRILRGGG